MLTSRITEVCSIAAMQPQQPTSSQQLGFSVAGKPPMASITSCDSKHMHITVMCPFASVLQHCCITASLYCKLLLVDSQWELFKYLPVCIQELSADCPDWSERDQLVRHAMNKFRLALRSRPDFDRGCYNLGTVFYTFACALQSEPGQPKGELKSAEPTPTPAWYILFDKVSTSSHASLCLVATCHSSCSACSHHPCC